MKTSKEVVELVERINEESRAGAAIKVAHIHAIISAANEDNTILDDLADLVEQHDELLTADELQARIGEMIEERYEGEEADDPFETDEGGD